MSQNTQIESPPEQDAHSNTKQCSVCEQQVPIQADVCPNCHSNMKRHSTILGAIGFFIFGFMSFVSLAQPDGIMWIPFFVWSSGALFSIPRIRTKLEEQLKFKFSAIETFAILFVIACIGIIVIPPT